ncbi:MAG: radical SAM protein [Planctomycetota bacterium]|nr:radical SAM protein [Planctomycetota bacterium]
MLAATCSELLSFAEWIRATDQHAAYHVLLLERADRVLSGVEDLPGAQRIHLADKLERWRYQHLHEHAGQLLPEDEAFIDALDLAANRLSGREARLPRATRWAIGDPKWDTRSIQETAALMDPRVPLDHVIRRATDLTDEHFGAVDTAAALVPPRRRMLLYAPLYVSSECVNFCTYCGFRYPHQIARKHLTVDQVVEQLQILRGRSFQHVLLVGGEFPSRTTTAYYKALIEALRREGAVPSIEIAPQSTASYAELVEAGAHGLTLYQETYDEQLYAEYHVRGPKSSYHWRLESHDRAAEAGVPRLGFGFLLGLADARRDLVAMLRHAAYLSDRFPDRTLAFGLPRIHETPPGFQVAYPVADADFVRMYCLLRIAFPRAELVLSTREPVALRNRLAKICITQMSAGSSTAPGGYQRGAEGLGEQFPVVDQRTPAEVVEWLEAEGLQAAWTLKPSV